MTRLFQRTYTLSLASVLLACCCSCGGGALAPTLQDADSGGAILSAPANGADADDFVGPELLAPPVVEPATTAPGVAAGDEAGSAQGTADDAGRGEPDASAPRQDKPAADPATSLVPVEQGNPSTAVNVGPNLALATETGATVQAQSGADLAKVNGKTKPVIPKMRPLPSDSDDDEDEDDAGEDNSGSGSDNNGSGNSGEGSDNSNSGKGSGKD